MDDFKLANTLFLETLAGWPQFILACHFSATETLLDHNQEALNVLFSILKCLIIPPTSSSEGKYIFNENKKL